VAIASTANGDGSLAIGYTGTTNLTLSHTISGTIIVSNNFDHFTINATGAKVSGSNYAALTVLGGSNLTINAGQFLGTTGNAGIIEPPVPEQGSQTNSVSSAAIGGVLYNTTNVQISGTTFSGAAYQPSSTTSYGSYGLQILDSRNVSITNGIIKGGSGTAASSESLGGHALYVESSDVAITNGTYTGGSAGASATSIGGVALYAQDSIIEISGNAKFTGGTAAPAVYANNSDLTIHDGTFQGGSFGTNSYFGLLSVVDAGKTNQIALHGGTFNSIDFAGAGSQSVVMDAGLTVEDFIVVDGGTITVTNQSNTPLQHTLIRNGNMLLVNDFTLSPGGSFVLDSAASHASFSSMAVESNAMFWIGQGTVEVDNSFSLAGGGTLSFSIVTNSYGSLTANSALFQTNATIQIDATAAAFTLGTNDVVLVSTDNSNGVSIVTAESSTNTASSANIAQNLNVEAYTSGRTEWTDLFSEDGSNLVFRFTTQSIKDYWNATGQLADLATELEGNAQMSLLIDMFNDPKASARAVEQTYFTTFNNLQIALLGMRSAVGQSISRGSEFREQLKLIPPGARGPVRKNDLRGWVKYYGHYFTHDRDGINPEYDSILHGGTIGIDTSIGNLLVGISGGSSRYRIDYDEKAQSDTVAYQGNLYGTYGMERAYIDAGLAYGKNQVDTRTAEPFVLEGEFDADMASAYLGGGYDLVDTKGGTVFTPEASVQYSTYKQDAYTEKSDVATPRVLDEFDADSLLGTMGMNISMIKTMRFDTFGMKVDGRVHWMHEFNPDPDNIHFMLQGGGNAYQLSYPSLDEDIYRIGIGATFFNSKRYQPKNVMLRLDFDELFGDGFNSHNLSAKLVYAF